jgi:hypothetical protein
MELNDVKSMSNEQIGMHLVELLGWERLRFNYISPRSCEYGDMEINQSLKFETLCKDLNAIAEAEKIVCKKVDFLYVEALCEAICPDASFQTLAMASARQRAEACVLALHRQFMFVQSHQNSTQVLKMANQTVGAGSIGNL